MNYGVQLYNFRTALAEDFKGAMREIAQIGFDGVEFAGNIPMEAGELAAFLKELHVECCGTMLSGEKLKDPADPVWEYAEKLNPPTVSISAHGDFAAKWQEILSLCLTIRKNAEEKGFLFSYHNHIKEFTSVEGIPAMYRILDAPGAEKIFVEPDICWLHQAGIDPAFYIRKYAKRLKQIHLKDIYIDPDPEKSCFPPLGKGIVDIKSAFAAAKESDCLWLIYEQDNSADPFKDAAESLAFMKKL